MPRHWFLLLAVLFLVCANAVGQQTACAPLTLPPSSASANMFTTEQEVALGDALYQQLSDDFKIIDDPALTEYAQRVTDRIAAHLPLGGLKPKIVLMDLPEANAYALPGGRMMFARKLIALTRTEDELASIIAHELGHIISHQTAEDFTLRFRKVLGVESIGSSDEVYQRLHELTENANRKEIRSKANIENERQQIADRIGLEAMVRAGYDPNAFVEIFDRTAQLKGKTGSWWANFWGATSPDARRLRETQRNVAGVSSGCVQQVSAVDRSMFSPWRTKVAEYSGSGHVASLRGVIDQRKLVPALTPDIDRFQFSLDGKYLLAQDETGIVVFTREPFKAKFRIDAADAEPAQFSPDMKSVVFHYGKSFESPRVERWSLLDGTREDISDVYVYGGCRQSELSPDGKWLLCVKDSGNATYDFFNITLSFNLQLLDVESGDVVFEKKSFGQKVMSLFGWILLGAFSDAVNAGFTPDGRYMMVSSGTDVLCFSLETKTPVDLPRALKSGVHQAFSFVGNDRVLGKGDNYKYSLMKFPSGEKIVEDMQLGGGKATHATSGDYIFIRPVKDFDVGLYDIKQKKIIRAYRKEAMDMYNGYFVRQRADADIEIRDLEQDQVWDKAALPPTKIRRLKAAAASPDLTTFAASLQTRGAVWDLMHSKRLTYVRGFEGAYLPDGTAFYAQFPKYGELSKAIAAFSLPGGNVVGQRQIEDDAWSRQYSQYVLVNKAKDSKNPKKGFNLEVHDLRTDKLLWTVPDVDNSEVSASSDDWDVSRRYYINDDNGTLALWGVGTSEKGKKLLQLDPEASRKFESVRDKKSSLYVAIYELQTGKRLAGLLLDTGKFSYSVRRATMVGDRIIIKDNRDRVLIYDRDGMQKGRIFAQGSIASAAANVLCVYHAQGRMEVFELSSLKKRDELVFPDEVTVVLLGADGKRMMVFTADQTIYTVDLTRFGGTSQIRKALK